MRGVYVAQIDIATLSTSKTILYGDIPSSIVVEILSANLTNLDQNTVEQLIVSLQRVTTKGSPTGTSVTATKSEVGSAASGVTWLGNLTAEPTTYDAATIDRQGANNLGGYYYDPLPECRQIIAPGTAFGLRLIDTPANIFRCMAQIVYREIG